MGVHRPKDIRALRTCELLLGRLIEDDYVMDDLGIFFNRYPLLGSGRELSITPEDVGKSRREFKRIHEREDYLQKQDVDLFFRLFRKHYRNWWD